MLSFLQKWIKDFFSRESILIPKRNKTLYVFWDNAYENLLEIYSYYPLKVIDLRFDNKYVIVYEIEEKDICFVTDYLMSVLHADYIFH